MKFEELQREQFRNGYNSGIEQGIKQGIAQGVEQGVQTATFNMIKTMLEDFEPDDKICRYTNCTPEYLANVKNQLKN